MPQNEMTAKFLTDCQRLLQVYVHASFPFRRSSAERSFTHRLSRKIGRKSFSMQLRDRKATPIDRDTFRHRQRARQSGSMNHHATAHVAQLERVQQSHMVNNSR